MGELKPGWRWVKFAQLAECANDRVDDPSTSGVDRYVGLDHLDPESLIIRRWGAPHEVESTKLRFKPGDIIFGKRRAYQRKLAVADFEGICSAHAMVLRAKPSAVLPEFLPFFMQSDTFMERAVAISVGSLSPTINWKTLAAEEFALPPLETQRQIISVLAKSEEVLRHRQVVVDAARAAFRSTIDEAFSGALSGGAGAPVKTDIGRVPSTWRICSLAEVTTKIVDGVHQRPDYVDTGVPFLTIENLTRGPGIDFSNTRFVSGADHAEFSKRAPVGAGDVLVSKDGTLGVARVVETTREFSIFVSLAVLKPSRGVLDPWFLRYYFESTMFLRRLASKASGSALKHIHLVDFRASRMPLPTYAEQVKLVEVIRAAERSLLRSVEGVASAKALKAALLGHALMGAA